MVSYLSVLQSGAHQSFLGGPAYFKPHGDSAVRPGPVSDWALKVQHGALIFSLPAMSATETPSQSFLGLGSLIDIYSEDWLADDSESEEAWLTPNKVAREFQATAQKLASITDISESSTDISAESLKTLHEKGVSSQTEIFKASMQDIGHIIAAHSLSEVQPKSSDDFMPKSSSRKLEDSVAISLDPFLTRHIYLKELELLWAEEESAGRDRSCSSAERRAQDSVRSLQVSSLLGKLRSAVQSMDERLACTVAELCSTEKRLRGEVDELDRMSQRLQCHL